MQSKDKILRYSFVVVGGGIAGVTCAETISISCPNEPVLLLTESTLIKTVVNLEPMSKSLYKFDVQEREFDKTFSYGINTLVDTLESIESQAKRICTVGKRSIFYKYLCICTGGQPKLIDNKSSRVIGIRDTDSVLKLQQRIKASRKVVLVGNGGIASELAYELKNIDIYWVIKNNYITSTFLDPGAAHFFQQCLEQLKTQISTSSIKRMRYCEILANKNMSLTGGAGAALGPDWHTHFDLSGNNDNQNKPKMYFNAKIESVQSQSPHEEFPLLVTLTTGEQIACDFMVSATGVHPRINFTCDRSLSLSDDGFISVNELMKTNIDCIYAAGDVCNADWQAAENWFQMRLWTQARQMGAMAGRSMVAEYKKEEIYQDFCFELFGHVTNLFGFQVILLGCFNGQGLGKDYEILLRTTPGKEYIKFVLCQGRLRGAILIGNSELTETCENLILNRLDVSQFGSNILNPDIDIEDFFD